MKPNFALRLAHDSIELLQRTSAGWLSVGSARMDAPDLDAEVTRLRDHAQRLAPEGITTKLIIPGTELRYETVLAPGPDDAARKKQIEAAIDGLTPYGLDELAYDWVVEGDHALVVIAAQETLSEAEDFAASHGLNPVSFVAEPSAESFLGEPFFGPARHAARLLPAGGRVLPDIEPVKVVGRARIPAAQTVPPAAAAPPPPPAANPSAGETLPKPAAQKENSAGTTDAKASADATPATGRPLPDPKTPPVPTAAAATAATPPPTEPTEPAIPDPRKRLAAEGAGTKSAPAAPRRFGGLPARPGGSDASRGAMSDLVRRLGARFRRDGATAASDAAANASAEDPATPGETPAESPSTPTFASRRKVGPALVSSRPAADAKAEAGGRIAVLAGAAEAGGTSRARSAMARMGETLRRRGRPEKPPETAAAGGATARSEATPSRPGDQSAKTVTAKTGGDQPRSRDSGKQTNTLDRAPARPPAPVDAIIPASRPPASEQEKAREAEALTIFGARSGESGGRDFNRRGLVLTAGLVVLLAALGIWVAYFAAPPESEFAELPATTEVPADPVTAPTALIEATPDSVADEAPAAPVAEETLAAPADEAPVDAPLAADDRMEALVEEALRQGEPAAGFADPDAAEIPAEAAETGTPGTPADRPVARLALPGPLERPVIELPQLVSLPPPPPFGTEMQLGDDGLIVATPEGAITPEGVTVFTRLPAAVPPDRPEIVVPETDAAPEAEPDAAEVEDASASQAVAPAAARETALLDLPAFELQVDVTPGANSALAGFRPVPRPVGEEPVAGIEEAPATAPAEEESPVSESAEGTRLASAPAGAIELAALRPASRPDSLVQTATPPAEPEIDLESATPQAVARSLRPNARPQGFASSVQRAIAAATQNQPEPAAAPAAPAAPAQTTATQPRIPTSASVAETATQRRAVNLRRVNLIGVFGSQSNRRALVRMPNGQVLRVQVGDTLDGGRVSAIGDTELRYVRGGRNQILRVGQSG
ncbi:hypothetical protein [Pararhodobacter sp. SW119]|uniref:hypothetical protein n=1 Tax=Pararhodobacter sp. SW119 TaxID=2780075 RepID=UPI001ADF1292|nr:hypothetical protein [Pararhodobacter sp. SW119]